MKILNVVMINFWFDLQINVTPDSNKNWKQLNFNFAPQVILWKFLCKKRINENWETNKGGIDTLIKNQGSYFTRTGFKISKV